VLFALSFFVPEGQTVDYHLHDTYYVIALPYVYLLLGFVHGFFWLIYVLLRSFRLNTVMIVIHFLLTLVPLVLFAIPISDSPHQLRDVSRHSPLLAGCLLLLFIGQILFITNVLIALILRVRAR